MIRARMPEEDLQIVGAYRLIEQVGAGGMGTVWLAEHSMLGRRAAIKLLHPEYSTRPEIVMRFFNEAKAAAAINDPGIVQIFDFGKHTDGRVYIAMELLEGEGLDRRLDRLGALSVDEALRIARQIANSLGAAHARGIIHRDLKPENIFIALDPEVPGGERAKILDFGIAKLAKDPSTVKTSMSTLLGTPTYMSPEQCRGAGQIDQRSDVYSLGCVLFALVTGRPPFEGEGAGDIIVQQLTVPAPLASSRSALVPRAVDELIARCLAKPPAERYGSGAELAAAISAVLGFSTGPALPAANMARTQLRRPALSAATTLSESSGSLVTAQPRRGRAVLVGAIGATVTIAIVIGVVVARTSSPGPDRNPAAQAPVTPPAIGGNPAGVPVGGRSPGAIAIDAGAPGALDTTPQIASVVHAFGEWARSHGGAACPTLDELGVGHDDAWGRPLILTCTDQPADQIIGIISAGPDGAPRTADDIASWMVREVAAMVRGEHWKPASGPTTATVNPGSTQVPTTPTTPTRPTRPTRPTKPANPGSVTTGDTDGDGIPDHR